MNRQTFALAWILTILVFLPMDAVSSPGAERLSSGIDSIFAEWNRAESPGAAVVVTDGGKTILARYYGTADLEHGVSIDATTRFELASVSKPFTAFGVLLLEKEGKLRLDDEIQKHLPELPDYGSPITIADLLHHTSGISDWIHVLPYAGRSHRTLGFGIDELLELVKKQRVLEFAPGAKWSYSNTNYALLAEIVARVTNRPFGEWMEENVFDPLGMESTSIPENGDRVIPNRANCYFKRPDGAYARSLVEPFQIPGPAHVFSTVEDMARWIDNLRTGALGGISIREEMRTKPILSNGESSFYGAGLGMGEYRGVRTVGHSGQTGSFKTELVYCPEVEVGVVVLGNAGWMRADGLSRRLLDLYLEDVLEPLPEAAVRVESEKNEASDDFRPDPADYARFLGGYRLENDPTVLVGVAREGEWLVGAIVGEGMDFFQPVARTKFKNRFGNCLLTFLDAGGEGGPAERVQINLRDEEMWATRVSPAASADPSQEYTGFYYSDELQVVYEIAGEAEGLAVHHLGSTPRPIYYADTDILVGGIGILNFLRGEGGDITGFEFSEPEDFGARRIRFAKRGECR